ncbi:MAG: hypothetical protein M3N13_09170, partial [Candidatus Eremiobacteraeota bacterium]|nr:hypothetical protein [Candidatus Eremiobacteraeota bacterium]
MKRTIPIVSAALLIAIVGCSQSPGTGALPTRTGVPQRSQYVGTAASNACPCYELLHSFAGGTD